MVLSFFVDVLFPLVHLSASTIDIFADDHRELHPALEAVVPPSPFLLPRPKFVFDLRVTKRCAQVLSARSPQQKNRSCPPLSSVFSGQPPSRRLLTYSKCIPVLPLYLHLHETVPPPPPPRPQHVPCTFPAPLPDLFFPGSKSRFGVCHDVPSFRPPVSFLPSPPRNPRPLVLRGPRTGFGCIFSFFAETETQVLENFFLSFPLRARWVHPPPRPFARPPRFFFV